MKKVFLCTFLFAFLFIISSSAQVYLNKDSTVTLSGYADGYYAYYTDSAGIGNFQKFPTTSPRSNSFGINIAMISLKYNAAKVRAVVGLHYGDIPLSTWSPTYNYIQEAWAGVRVGKKVWLDAGFFRSHIGAEGLLPKENIASSVTVGTFNEPYYEAGIRLSTKPTEKFSLDIYALNGYNIYEDNNSKKSGGLLATYAINDHVSIAYANYLGNDAAGGPSHFRTYHNAFLNYEKNKIKLQLSADFATQTHSDTLQSKGAHAFSGFATGRYRVAANAGIYARGEFFNDDSGFLGGAFIDNNNRTTGLKIWGATAGADYRPADNAYVKLEGRFLQATKNREIFRQDGENKSYRFEIMFHIGCYF